MRWDYIVVIPSDKVASLSLDTYVSNTFFLVYLDLLFQRWKKDEKLTDEDKKGWISSDGIISF